jgi:hypothetical protein
VISGALIEFIAGINFLLYSRASRQQFTAFHVCLERMHRYLVAYKITENSGSKREETLHSLVCIMANATMITHQDVESVEPRPETVRTAPEAAK